MKQKILGLSIALASLMQSASADYSRLPEEFSITERFFSMTATFDISTPLGPYATARKRFFSWTTTFDLEDADSQPLAYAKSKFLSWGTIADVFDPHENKLGWIEEVTWKFIAWPEYRLFNSHNQLAALAKLNFWGNRFDIYEPDHSENLFAVIKRPFIRIFRDRWTAEIHNPAAFETGYIDPRLLIMLAVYQTDRENRERLRSEIETQLIDELNDSSWSGAQIEENDSLTALLEKVDALDVSVPYTSEEEAQADLEMVAGLRLKLAGEQSSPLDAYRQTIESILAELENKNLTESERQALIRLLKEYRNI